jgi:hypothetical protein
MTTFTKDELDLLSAALHNHENFCRHQIQDPFNQHTWPEGDSPAHTELEKTAALKAKVDAERSRLELAAVEAAIADMEGF